jgi:hypothetical protein
MISKVKGIEYNPPRTVGDTTGYTGVTTERVVNSLLIPGGSLKQYDLLGIDSRLRKVGTVGTATIRIRIGTAVNTSQQLVATYTATNSTGTLIPIMRRLSINNLTNSTYAPSVTTSNAWDHAGPTISWQNITTINWANDQYIIITSQCTNSADTVYCPYIITDFIQGS